MQTATPPAATLADLAAAFPAGTSGVAVTAGAGKVLAGATPDELATGIRAHWQARQ